MKRETGFYWVKYKNEWLIAYFNHYNPTEEQYWWSLPGDWGVDDLSDEDLSEIDENMIVRE